ncbi:PD40 domain-containing protein [Acrocarpospora macrocephala]|uniref:TolB-like translocation protein signal peptide n=1 Tax=Acrocarpospora macrocephala TaxID=150177 RepID=A0A5M3WQZ8_9ACTN|nr:PD40 domain-containing protein [Acrocarpospora macrocephala]GES10572.1 TolB-like translocation protein; signal peptide [Acrocarpospora macrocephala]
MTSLRARLVVISLATVLLAGIALTYAVLAPAADAPASTALAGAGPRVQVLTNGLLSTVSRADPGGPREVTAVRCDRAHTGAATVACLTPVGALTATSLVVMDAALRPLKEIPLTGFPNRLRVSASGRMIAWTLFIDGHSYATNGFSTQTGILDTRTGRIVRSLEDFTITRDGRPYRNADVNFWGVTFAGDDNRFYATLSTGGRRSLVEGDMAAGTVRTLRDNVECPSLSPDGTRIAYKSAIGADPAKGWRLTVLHLGSGRTVPLAETRSVDDQPAWLDDQTIAYGLQTGDGTNNTWTVPADGGGAPTLLIPGANSPAVIGRDGA